MNIHISPETEFETNLVNIEQPNKPFRIQNKRIMLTYKHHIDKSDIFNKITNNGARDVKFLRIAHETADPANQYNHTHVVVEFTKIFQSTNCRIFDITEQNELIHPNIKKITTAKHWDNAIRYLAKEDPDNKDLENHGLSIVNKIWSCETREEALNHAEKFTDVNGIIQLYSMKPRKQITVREPTYSWQTELIRELENNEHNDREIIWYYDPKTKTGKTTVCRFLMANYPNKYLCVNDIGSSRDFATVIMNSIQKGWDGSNMLISLSFHEMDHKIYRPLENLKDGIITATKYQGCSEVIDIPNVVIFSNWLPKPEAWKRKDVFKVRTIEEEEGGGYKSRALTLREALEASLAAYPENLLGI